MPPHDRPRDEEHRPQMGVPRWLARRSPVSSVSIESTPTPPVGVDYTHERRLSLLFLVVPTLLMLFVSVGPLLYSLVLSFFKWKMDLPMSRPVFTGLDNYVNVVRDPVVRQSLHITVIYVLVCVGAQLVLGMLGALLITGGKRGVGLLRTAFLVPFMMTPVVVGVLWRTLLHSIYGPINYALGLLFHMPTQPWLGDIHQALIAVILVEIWMHTPVAVFILAAGMQALPIELHKAAVVDGASKWQIFRHITLPLLKPVIMVVLLVRTMEAIKQVDLIYTLTYGGPGRATEFMSLLIYKLGLQYFRIGEATATSWFLLLLVLGLGVVFLRSILKKE